MIDLKQTLAIINTGEWVSLSCFTADVVKNKGGKIVDYPRCRLAQKNAVGTGTNDSPRHKSQTTNSKNPAHNYNFTLNLDMDNGQTRKIHPLLITHINKIRVI